jgi:hypothetical protein
MEIKVQGRQRIGNFKNRKHKKGEHFCFSQPKLKLWQKNKLKFKYITTEAQYLKRSDIISAIAVKRIFAVCLA